MRVANFDKSKRRAAAAPATLRAHPPGAAPARLQPKLTVGRPDDEYEKEADQIADEVMRMPDPAAARRGIDSAPIRAPGIQRACKECEDELQRRARSPAARGEGFNLDGVDATLRQPGRPLDAATRAFFEPRFGVDFGGVRVHTDAQAAASAREVSALAYTVGRDVVFNTGQYAPHSESGRRLLAHELTHVVQQSGAEPGRISPSREENGLRPLSQNRAPGVLQRRLVMFGTLTDVNAMLGMLAPPAGLTLNLNVANNQVQIAAVLPAAPPSPALRAQLTTIINHATQHAEVIVARGQPQVQVGAFPQPSDLTVTRVQQIDIDDILAIEAGAPGNGVGKAMHEIQENFFAHASVPAGGTDLFPAAHQDAIRAESAVASELVGPGRRVASVAVAAGGETRNIQDFENYYLVYRTRPNAATQDVRVTSARRRAKDVVSTRTIDNFPTSGLFSPLGGRAVPAAGGAIVTAAAADVAAEPTATVRIEGFADDNELGGDLISGLRATDVQALLVAAGVAQGRIHFQGRGRTNFAVPNTSAANRALNRRVVITVTRPGAILP
jgi:outer membrane protein OmpA-like peptidoglycan-associated protein